MVDGLPGREVVGKQAPGAAAADDVEDGVEDLAQGMYPGAAGSRWGSRQNHSSSERSL